MDSAVYRPVEVSYDHRAAVKMNPHHWYSSSTHSDERLVFRPGTSHHDARLEPLPDSSSSEDDWIKPNSVLRGDITHLAAQGVDLPRSGLTTQSVIMRWTYCSCQKHGSTRLRHSLSYSMSPHLGTRLFMSSDLLRQADRHAVVDLACVSVSLYLSVNITWPTNFRR